MTSGLFAKLLGRSALARQRKLLRTYLSICRGPAPFLVSDILAQLSRAPLGGGPRGAQPSSDLLVRQILMSLLGQDGPRGQIVAVLAGCRRSFDMMLPPSWRATMRAQGIRVGTMRSRLAWMNFLFVSLMQGVRRFSRLLAIPVGAHRQEMRQAGGLIFGLPSGTLPRRLPDGSASHDFVSWARDEYWALGTDASVVVQTKDKLPAPDFRGLRLPDLPFPGLISHRAKAAFAFASVAEIVAASALAVLGRWHSLVMLSERLGASYVRRVGPDVFPKRIMSHIGNGVLIRPHWTYVLEEAGHEVCLVLYSSNFVQWSQIQGQKVGFNFDLPLMSWPRYVVWCEANRATLVDAGQSFDAIDIADQIDFIDAGKTMPEIERPFVAIFDVAPFRSSTLARMGYTHPYYSLRTAHRFLSHVTHALCETGMAFALKNKRSLSAADPKGYTALMQHVAALPGANLLDWDIAARRVIEQAHAVIVMPFSSPGLIAERMGKMVAYYDPTGGLMDDRGAADGVPILRSRAELDVWIRGLSSQTTRVGVRAGRF